MPYSNKQKKQEYTKRYYEINKDKIKAKSKQWKLNNSIRYNKLVRNWKRNNPEKMKLIRQRGYLRAKFKILLLLGGKCIKCGESDWRVLDIDHIYGSGSKERKSFNNNWRKYFKHVYNEVLNGSKQYQLLCSNCNRRKEMERRGYKEEGKFSGKDK